MYVPAARGPADPDHKYTYSHIGYNLKATDMQAAVGVAQLKKLPGFIEQRRENFRYLYAALEDLKEFLILPEATPNSNPSWPDKAAARLHRGYSPRGVQEPG